MIVNVLICIYIYIYIYCHQHSVDAINRLHSTGKITFRCLLKVGPANTGKFFYPNNGNDLVLSQASPKPASVKWVRGAKGQSCDAVCAATDRPRCDESAFTSTLPSNSATQTTQSEALNKIALKVQTDSSGWHEVKYSGNVILYIYGSIRHIYMC